MLCVGGMHRPRKTREHMTVEYEWCVVTIAPGHNADTGGDFDGHGPRVRDLKACIEIAQRVRSEGGQGWVVLHRNSDCGGWNIMGWDHERQEAEFVLGHPAPTHWADMPNWCIPQRFVTQWNTHGEST